MALLREALESSAKYARADYAFELRLRHRLPAQQTGHELPEIRLPHQAIPYPD